MDRLEASLIPVLIVVAAALSGCSGSPPEAPAGSGGSSNTGGSPQNSGGTRSSNTGGSPQNSGGTPDVAGPDARAPGTPDSQTPPQGGDQTQAWLDTGAYLDWACEPEVHESRSPSPHGFNRICSNDVLAAAADGDGEWPAGAAGVKELYDSLTATEPMGFSVYLKLEDDSAEGNNWYWYERFPSGLIAAGTGARGCTGCHGRAGSNAASTPTPGARDYVFTPVR